MWTEKNNSFENMLERLNLNPLPVIDEEIYKPWVLYSRPREMLKPNEYYFFAYLRNLRKRTHKYGFSDLSTFSGPHRCLTKGNKVLLSDGSWKNIEDVIIGDKVFSPQKDGSVIISKVVDTTSYYCDNVYDVIEAKGKNKKLYSCSGNHLIPLYGIVHRRTKNGRKVERSIKEITAEHISSLKKATTFRLKDYCPSRISIKCVKTESQKVYGITLDSPSHWFITNDWIVTCNSGKSTSACFFAWLLDDTFKDNFKKRVIYNPEDLDQYILNADKLYTLNKKNIGCAVVIDEAGNTLEALAYYSEFSRKFSTTLQTMGYLKSRIFFISPNRKNVASSIRSMANTHYNVKRPNSTTYTTVSPRELKYDHLRDTSWNKRPVIRYFGEKIMLQTLKIHGIPSEILKKYLEVEGYKSDMIKNKYSVQKEIEEKNKDEIDIDDAVRKVKDNLLHFLNMRENGVHIDAIAYQLKVSRRVSNLIKMRVERELKQEGYVFPGSSKKRIKEEEDE